MLADETFYFVAVNFNNADYTISFIDSINNLNQIQNNCRVVIVDNNSEINDFNKLKKFCDTKSNVILIRNEKNCGYFPALNTGLSHLNKGKLDYVTIGNNDITFNSDYIQKLKSIRLDCSTLVIAPNIIKLQSIHQNPHVIKKFNFIQRVYRKVFFTSYYFSIILQLIYSVIKFLSGGSNRKFNEIAMPILMGYGACYVLTPNFFKHFNYLDAPVFLMGEEGILANQVLSAGGITMYYPEIIVHHHDHSSTRKLQSRAVYKFSQDSYIYYLKNCKFVQ